MKLPRFLPADNANHRARGADVASVGAVLVIVVAMLLIGKPALAAFAGAVAGPAAGFLAGKAVERWQARQNRKALDEGRPAPHSVDPLDVKATLRGAAPVALPLILLAVLLAV